MKPVKTGVKFHFVHNDFKYDVVAFPIKYVEGGSEFELGNYEIEIHMPYGSWLKTDFYP